MRSDLLKRHSHLHKDSSPIRDASSNKRQKLSSHVAKINDSHSTSSNARAVPEIMINVGGTGTIDYGSAEPIVDQSPASIMAYSDDGGLNFNDLAMWSEHTFFDMPFAGTSSVVHVV